MKHKNRELLLLLENLDLGVSVAESDTLLEAARIETSTFSDLFNDRVDLIPGTKGSGKTALFRIFVEFLPQQLLDQKKVIIAHGVSAPGDPIFHAFSKEFSELSEDDFVSFWCIYLVSLAHEQFIKNIKYKAFLSKAAVEIDAFRMACKQANIPEIQSEKSLHDIIQWTLSALKSWRPKFKVKEPETGVELELDLFRNKGDISSDRKETTRNANVSLPKYANEIKNTLEKVLESCDLSLWLMVDRLDEIFPRRSEVERKALRGLLRAINNFRSPNIRVKVFLRDDMLEQIVFSGEGFTALTHVTARQSDTLRWEEEQIKTFIMKRFMANNDLIEYLKLDKEKLNASAKYRDDCFYKIFPSAVYKGPKQSTTLRWICNRCSDGRGVVTPRDVLDLLIRAKQKQQDIFSADPDGSVDYIIGAAAIQYGYEELSKRKRDTYLSAEFPHLWQIIQKFSEGKTEYSDSSIKKLLGPKCEKIIEDLLSIGFLSRKTKSGKPVFSIPFLYRHAMKLTQGSA